MVDLLVCIRRRVPSRLRDSWWPLGRLRGLPRTGSGSWECEHLPPAAPHRPEDPAEARRMGAAVRLACEPDEPVPGRAVSADAAHGRSPAPRPVRRGPDSRAPAARGGADAAHAAAGGLEPELRELRPLCRVAQTKGAR